MNTYSRLAYHLDFSVVTTTFPYEDREAGYVSVGRVIYAFAQDYLWTLGVQKVEFHNFDDFNVDRVTFNQQTVRDCLDMLAFFAGATWKIVENSPAVGGSILVICGSQEVRAARDRSIEQHPQRLLQFTPEALALPAA